MHDGKASVTQIGVFGGVVNVGEQQEQQPGIHISFMHSHRKYKDRQNQKGGKKGVFLRILFAAYAQKQYKHDNCHNDRRAHEPVGDAQKGIVLADPVQAEKSPHIAGVHGRVGVGAHGAEILRPDI